jgi:tetratricopeptide (TPR) repeat protein
MTIVKTLEQAITLHQTGHLENAEQLYRNILQTDPENPEANHNLGLLMMQQDQTDDALAFFTTALNASPNSILFWVSYIDALIYMEQFDVADNILKLGRSNGLEGEAFDQLDILLATAIKKTTSTNQTLKKVIKPERLLSRAKSNAKKGEIEEARKLYSMVLETYPQNKQAKKGLKTLQYIKEVKKNQSHPLPAQVDFVIALYSQGKIQEAFDSVETLIKDFPSEALLYNIRGACFKEFDQLDHAVNSYEKALAIKPDYAEAHNNLGVTLNNLGQLGAAVNSYGKALAIKPDYAEVHSNLADTLHEFGQLEAAIRSYKMALAIKPNYAEAHYSLGNTFKGIGQPEAAVKCYEKALAIKSNYAEAHSNLGVTLQELGQLDAAVKSYEKALAIKPDYADAHYNLGVTLQELGQLDAAVKSYGKALAIKPDYADAHYNLGVTLQELDLLDAAVKSYEQALAIKPDYTEAHSNLGITHRDLGHLGTAINCYKKALAISPDHAVAKWNLSLSQLVTGNFKEGWKNYESRLKKKDFKQERHYSQPLWGSSSLVGKTLFLYPEQGIGDMIQFIRYVKVLSTKTTKIIVECPKSLHQLFSTIPEINVLVTKGDALPHFDYHVPLLSLPKILKTTIKTIPVDIPYLFLEKNNERPVNTQPRALNIGIVWAGNSAHNNDKNRSVDLSFFSAIMNIHNTQFYSLQVGDRRDDLNQEDFASHIIDAGKHLGHYAETATVINQLNLIITVDTSVAHLAGAMGKPVWVLLPFASDWRWLLERYDSPWYPTMRLFRQQSRGDWESVFNEVHKALETYRMSFSKD